MLFVTLSVCRGLYPGNVTNCTVFEIFSDSDFIQQVAPLELPKQEHKSNLQNIQVSKIMSSCCDWLCVVEAAGYFPPVVYMATGFLFLTLCCSDLALKWRTSFPTVSEDSSTPKNTPAWICVNYQMSTSGHRLNVNALFVETNFSSGTLRVHTGGGLQHFSNDIEISSFSTCDHGKR